MAGRIASISFLDLVVAGVESSAAGEEAARLRLFLLELPLSTQQHTVLRVNSDSPHSLLYGFSCMLTFGKEVWNSTPMPTVRRASSKSLRQNREKCSGSIVLIVGSIDYKEKSRKRESCGTRNHPRDERGLLACEQASIFSPLVPLPSRTYFSKQCRTMMFLEFQRIVYHAWHGR